MTPTKQAEPEDATDLLSVQEAALKKQLEDVKRRIKEKAEEAAKPKYQRTQDTEELLAELAAINKKLDYISSLQDQLWESLPKKELASQLPADQLDTTQGEQAQASEEDTDSFFNTTNPKSKSSQASSDTPDWDGENGSQPKNRKLLHAGAVGICLFFIVIIVLFYVLKV